MSDGIRVTVEDLATGERAEQVIEPGNYVLLCAAPCRLYHEQHEANGSTTLVLKGRRRDLMATKVVAGQ